MGRRSQHSQNELRAMCITATTALISESGLNELCTQKITYEIGDSLSTLYQTFSNSDDIILATNTQTLLKLYTCRHSPEIRSQDGTEHLFQLAYRYIESAREHTYLWLVLFEHHQTDKTDIPPYLQKRINSFFELVDNALQQYPSIPLSQHHLTAQTLWSGAHGIYTLELSGKSALPVEHTAKQLTNFLIMNHMNALLPHERYTA